MIIYDNKIKNELNDMFKFIEDYKNVVVDYIINYLESGFNNMSFYYYLLYALNNEELTNNFDELKDNIINFENYLLDYIVIYLNNNRINYKPIYHDIIFY